MTKLSYASRRRRAGDPHPPVGYDLMKTQASDKVGVDKRRGGDMGEKAARRAMVTRDASTRGASVKVNLPRLNFQEKK